MEFFHYCFYQSIMETVETRKRLVKCYVWNVLCYVHVKQGLWEEETETGLRFLKYTGKRMEDKMG